MAIEKGTILTPEKKGLLLDEVKSELSNVSDSLSKGQYGKVVTDVLTKNQQTLQGLLDSLMQKKGVITPKETNNALDILNTSKKARLQEDYVMGVKAGTFYLISFVLLAGVGFYIYKKYK
jgi:hypothetical protein